MVFLCTKLALAKTLGVSLASHIGAQQSKQVAKTADTECRHVARASRYQSCPCENPR